MIFALIRCMMIPENLINRIGKEFNSFLGKQVKILCGLATVRQIAKPEHQYR